MANSIPNPQRRERLLVKNGRTSDIIAVVMDVANDDQVTAQVAEFAQRFKGISVKDQYEKLKELWKYTRREIQYEEDPPGKQFIKEPARVFWDNQKGDGTDCKSLSLFEYFCCRAIGVPCYFEFVSYFEWWEDKSKRITHVYPVAIVDGREVVIDAVHTKFDQRAPGATRVVKKYSKVFKQMADIYRVSGITKGGAMPSPADLVAEYKDRAKLVKPTAFVDYPMMSAGEMETFLLAQRAKMLWEFFQGTPQGAAYRQQFEQRRDALYRGLHRGFNVFGAKSRTQAASGWLTLAEKGIDLKRGFSALFDDAEAGAERASVGAIPKLDCNALFPFQLPADADWKITYNTSQSNKRMACENENLWRDALNADWPANGAVLIYEFLPDSGIPSNLSNSSKIKLIEKRLRHRDFVRDIQGASKITRSNLDIWLVNGCIEKSINGANGQSLGPQAPSDYISTFRQAGQEGIGFPFAVIPIAIAVLALNYKALKHLVAVIKGKENLKQAIKAQVGNIQAFIEKYSDDVANLAGKADWKLPDPNDPDGSDATPTPTPGGNGSGFLENLTNEQKIGGALLIGTGLYMLSNSKD